jgi:hypothetical protein
MSTRSKSAPLSLTRIISTTTKTNATVSPPILIFEEESNFNLIILNDAHIRLYSMDLQKPQEGKGSFPAYFNQQNPYLLEI